MDLQKVNEFLRLNGYGSGNGYGIKNINGHDVFIIDDVNTVLTVIRGNVAKGFVLERNVVLKPCYVVKGNGFFAHGETLSEARKALEDKIIADMDVEEKIQRFKEQFPKLDEKHPAKEFYNWHHRLTGSCEMGRKNFAANHGIDIDNDTMTVREFIKLTKSSFCGEIIKQLEESYGER